MPLNQLENFIKNTEGRILYVNPNDLDSTDSIVNQGNSLTKPFKTIQRALLEAARFSYLRGRNNDIVEKTTILLFPGEHIIDNRPGYAIKQEDGSARAVSPNGIDTLARDTLSLTLTTNFDLTQEDNLLYKFNSIYGGVVVPRGTSIVGLDLRKIKIRPKYVPNPTDPNVPSSAIFRITGACYFWQFSIFDGDESGLVYTDDTDFSTANRSVPTFSHHKLTCFEYADGVNIPTGYDITDLDMYYSKLSNAFNESSGRSIPSSDKYPDEPFGFAKQRPEWEIVGAFAPDPFVITSIQAGDGLTPSNVITVITERPHGFSAGTPIKIRGVSVQDYNISTKVQSIDEDDVNKFTYVLPFVRSNLPATPAAASATVTIETDTVSGASPYIFNCSLRSVWGMNGLLADGSKAAGFRSMVTAQFTAVSLQKDDRAFVKYDPKQRIYKGLNITPVNGTLLSSQSSSTDNAGVYHLDAEAIYRRGWETSHIKLKNDAFIQVVSVFAIGFNKHFDAESGGDASITNSNSNFGQFSLAATGYKAEAFAKDDTAYVTSIMTPRAIVSEEEKVDWASFDIGLTTSVSIPNHLYIFGFKNPDIKPPIILQQYRLGAKFNDKVYLDTLTGVGGAKEVKEASIFLTDSILTDTNPGVSNRADGTQTSEKFYRVIGTPSAAPSSSDSTIFNLGVVHGLQTGEKVRIFSDDGDLPENLVEHKVYFAIKYSSTQIQLASSLTNAQILNPITVSGGSNLSIVSRVSDKEPGELGSPVQYDPVNSNWFINTNSNNSIYTTLQSLGVAGFGTDRTEVTYIKRNPDSRSLDEKLYKMRVVIPKETVNARDPVVGFVLQDSGLTAALNNTEFNKTTLTSSDYSYERNPRYITRASVDGITVTIISDLPHNLKTNDIVIVKGITSTTNTEGDDNIGYNGSFRVTEITNASTFKYITTDIFGTVHNPGTFTNNINVRNTSLPRFQRNDLQSNYFVYRNEVISPFIYGVQDGIYHLYVLNSSNKVIGEFDNIQYGQNIVDLYPQLDNDNPNDNPNSASSFAKRYPLGEVVSNDLKKSITKETVDKFVKDVGIGQSITGITTTFSSVTAGTAVITFGREHGLNGITTYSSLTGGSGYTAGTYHNVRLNNFGSTTWNGATAKVVVISGQVRGVDIIAGGSGYTNGQVLEFDSTVIGPGVGAQISIDSAGISNDVGNTIQVTGIGTTSDGYYRIASIPSRTQVSVAVTNGDPRILRGQYVLNIGPSIQITSTSYNSSTGITTFTCSSAHGLVIGNQFRVINTSNINVGDFFVDEKVSATVFTAKTNKALSVNNGYVLKHGLSSNEAVTGVGGENLGTRGFFMYDSEFTTLSVELTKESSTIRIPVTQSQLRRFPLGSFLQIDNEIVRVASKTLTGAGNNQLLVIRGYLGTRTQSHASGTLVKKIKPIPVEFRRPSILRASGHTFEYLGFGPGNYSTGLPQVQVRALTEREAFLSQSQQRSCGSVVYTGMNNDGDFFIGNTKYSATSGEQITFGIPIPTVTGRDPSRLSVVFDEVTIKERLIVEGGNSSTILSQFDGPVNFNGEVRINAALTINASLRINENLRVDGQLRTEGEVIFNNTTNSSTINDGAVVIKGGVGIAKNVNVGGNLNVAGSAVVSSTTQSTTKDNGALVVEGGVGIEKNLNVGGNASVTGTSTLGGLVTANTGIVPDVSKGAYIGSSTLPFSQAYIGEIRIGVTDDNTINTQTGDLILSATGIVRVNDNLSVSGTATITGATTLSSSLSVTGTSTLGGLVTANTGIVPDVNKGAYLGSSTLAFSQSYIGEIRIGVTDDNTINTQSGDLVLAATGLVRVNDNLSVTGTTTLNSSLSVTGTSTLGGLVTVNTGIVPDVSQGAYIGSSTLPFSQAYIGAIRIGVSDDNTINTTTGNLKLSAAGLVSVNDNLTVSGTTTLSSTLSVSGTTTLSGSVNIAGSLSLNDAGLELFRSGGAFIDLKRSISEDFNVRINNFTSGVLGVNGALSVTGDITAFASDERLKTNIKPIRNALDKVFALSGFTYNFNDIGEKLGFSKEITHVGVSAQQVELVLPEAVVPCPADNNYLTVKYEKLVPLLIEAIKELKEEVDQLRRMK
jgi:hypothetical protein